MESRVKTEVEHKVGQELIELGLLQMSKGLETLRDDAQFGEIKALKNQFALARDMIERGLGKIETAADQLLSGKLVKPMRSPREARWGGTLSQEKRRAIVEELLNAGELGVLRGKLAEVARACSSNLAPFLNKLESEGLMRCQTGERRRVRCFMTEKMVQWWNAGGFSSGETTSRAGEMGPGAAGLE
jgi:hypothetical protein